jgi:tetratricopeptide (TPR) repeat protein/ribosomal protein L24E
VLRNRLIAATFCLLSLSLPAVAGYDQGQELYKQKQYPQAAAEYEDAVAKKPKHAMAHYKLGLTYGHLNRHAEALTELEKALALDPGLAARTKIGEAIDRERAKAGRSSTGTNGRSSADRRSQSQSQSAPTGRSQSSRDEGLIPTLQKGAIYVHPAMRAKLSEADEAALAKHLASKGMTIKAVLVPTTEVRKEAASLAAYANRLSSYLRLGTDGVVIVASDKGVAAVGGSLKQADMAAIVADSLVDFSSSYKTGIANLADRIAARRQTKETQSTGFWAFLLLIAGAIGGMIWWRRKAKVKALKLEINGLMGQFSDRMSAAGDDLQYVTSNPQAVEARQLFDEATAIYLDVDKKLPETGKPADLEAFRPRMRKALTMMGQSQTMIKALINGQEPPKRSELTEKDVLSADEAGRSVVGSPSGCFFCSRPVTPEEGSLVDVKQDGRTIRVLACPTCTSSLEHGQTPQVVGYYDQGRFTPWYERPGYDYNRDRSGLTLGDVMLLNWMFDRPSHHHHYHDDYDRSSSWRQDEGTAERYTSNAAEGSLMGSGSSYSDSGQAAEGSFWSSSSSDHS